MSRDILAEIVAKRKADMSRQGITFGMERPVRNRPLHPFVERPGTILEIKRSSPSKGNIAMDLDPRATAQKYAAAGTSAISVLTESNYFHGSLADLECVARSAPEVAILRKDFLLTPEEIDVAYDFGADAVLLIARILSDKELKTMAGRARTLGMTPFVEIRTQDDLRKLKLVQKDGTTVAGVNARDLRTFAMDPLVPAAFRKHLGSRAVFESGILSPEDATFARRLGFEGILVGEAAARNPDSARNLVKAFLNAQPDRYGTFWKSLAEARETVREKFPGKPLAKICGLTNAEDASLAAELGANMLGFVFYAQSARKADAQTVRKISQEIGERFEDARPLLVGVVAESGSPEEETALSLASEGILDAIQFHGYRIPEERIANFGCYEARRIQTESQAQDIRKDYRLSFPRTLIDAYHPETVGGTGMRIEDALVDTVREKNALWMAGGISPENIEKIVERFQPELVDLSSSLEETPGKKAPEKLRKFFEAVRSVG